MGSIQIRGQCCELLLQLMDLLGCFAGLLGESRVLVCQFLNAEALALGVRAVDLVPEQFGDALPMHTCLVAESLIFLAQELTLDLDRSSV